MESCHIPILVGFSLIHHPAIGYPVDGNSILATEKEQFERIHIRYWIHIIIYIYTYIYIRIHTQYIMCCRIKYWIHIQCQSDFWMVQHQWSAISPCWPSSPANPRLEYWIWTGLALTRGQFGAMLLFLRYTNTYIHIVKSIYMYSYIYIGICV